MPKLSVLEWPSNSYNFHRKKWEQLYGGVCNVLSTFRLEISADTEFITTACGAIVAIKEVTFNQSRAILFDRRRLLVYIIFAVDVIQGFQTAVKTCDLGRSAGRTWFLALSCFGMTKALPPIVLLLKPPR